MEIQLRQMDHSPALRMRGIEHTERMKFRDRELEIDLLRARADLAKAQRGGAEAPSAELPTQAASSPPDEQRRVRQRVEAQDQARRDKRQAVAAQREQERMQYLRDLASTAWRDAGTKLPAATRPEVLIM